MSDVAFEHWIYLDTQFVQASYEYLHGKGPKVEETFTREVGVSASIGVMGGGAAGSVSNSYSVSGIKVADEIYDHLMSYQSFEKISETVGKNTCICTVDGLLYTTVRETTRTRGKEKTYSETIILMLYVGDTNIELLPRAELFLGGMSALMEKRPTKKEDYSVPVRALIRLFPVTEGDSRWAAIPLFIHEKT